MSIDATYDMMQAGHKIRVLECPYEFGKANSRENARTESPPAPGMVRVSPNEVTNMIQTFRNAVKDAERQVTENGRRIEALERDRGGSSGDPEYYVQADHRRGTFSDDREYPVPVRKAVSFPPNVDRKNGIIVGD